MLYLAKAHKLQQHDISTAWLCHGLGLGLGKGAAAPDPPQVQSREEQSCRTDSGRGAALGRNLGKARGQAGPSALPLHGEQNTDQPLSISVSKSLN